MNECVFSHLHTRRSNPLLLLQAKEHDIFDTSSFLRSKLFSTNGFKLNDDVIEKRFKRDED
jgi:DNA replication licensing factor MCM2